MIERRSEFPQASNQSPKNKKPQSRVQSGGGGKKSSETAKKNKKQQEAGEEEEAGGGTGTGSSTPKKTATASSQAKKSSPAPPPAAKPESPACVKRAKTARDNNRDLGLCRYRTRPSWGGKSVKQQNIQTRLSFKYDESSSWREKRKACCVSDVKDVTSTSLSLSNRKIESRQ